MSGSSEKHPQTKMFWSVSTKNEDVCISEYMQRVFLKVFKVPVAILYD